VRAWCSCWPRPAASITARSPPGDLLDTDAAAPDLSLGDLAGMDLLMVDQASPWCFGPSLCSGGWFVSCTALESDTADWTWDVRMNIGVPEQPGVLRAVDRRDAVRGGDAVGHHDQHVSFPASPSPQLDRIDVGAAADTNGPLWFDELALDNIRIHCNR
jgi:hypothetical protein